MQYEHDSVVDYLLRSGADPMCRTVEGSTPLHVCDNVKIAKILIACGAQVNAVDIEGNTPLHDRMSEGETAVAETLIEQGADVNARNGDGRTPLHVAADAGRVDMMVLLLQRGASLHIKDDVRWWTVQYVLCNSTNFSSETLHFSSSPSRRMSRLC